MTNKRSQFDSKTRNFNESKYARTRSTNEIQLHFMLLLPPSKNNNTLHFSLGLFKVFLLWQLFIYIILTLLPFVHGVSALVQAHKLWTDSFFLVGWWASKRTLVHVNFCVFRLRKIVIACNNGLFSVKHKVMLNCVQCSTPLSRAQKRNSFVSSLILFFILFLYFVLLFFCYFSFVWLVRYSVPIHLHSFYDHCCCSSIENCMHCVLCGWADWLTLAM